MLGNNLGIAGTVEGSKHAFEQLHWIVRPAKLPMPIKYSGGR